MRQVWVTCGLGRGRRKLSFLESRGTKRHSSAAQGRNADSEATSPHVPDEQTNQPKRKVSLLETHQVPPEGPTAAPLQRPGLGGHHPASWARRHRRPAAGTTEMLRLAVRRHRPEVEAEAEPRSLPGHRRTCPRPPRLLLVARLRCGPGSSPRWHSPAVDLSVSTFPASMRTPVVPG